MKFESAKSFVAAEAVPPIDPKFDVAQVATRGHVLSARVSKISNWLFLPALAVAAVAGFTLYKGGLRQSDPSMPPAFIRNALTFDEDSYFDLGGGLRGGPSVAWMADYKPTPESLSSADYEALATALRDDVVKHGNDAKTWEAVATLKVTPRITRPEKAADDFRTRLKDGIIAVPEGYGAVTVLAYVDGAWALSQFSGDGCQALIGPVPKGCNDETRDDGELNGSMFYALDEIKPKAAKE